MQKKFYEKEEIPAGRFCTTCERFIEADGLAFLSEHRGVTLYLDPKTGTAHTLLTEKQSNIRRAKRYPVKPKVETVIYNPVPSATVPPNVATETHIEAPQPKAPHAVQPEVEDGNDETGEQPTAPHQSDETPDNWAMWEPQPDDWFHATVTAVNKGFMFLQLTNGDDVFAPFDIVQFPNNHRCVIQPADVASVRIEPTTRGTSQWTASEVFFQTQHEVPPEPEKGTVLWWVGRHGVVIRECDCRMFVRTWEEQPFDVDDEVTIFDYQESIDPAHPGRFAKQIEFAGEPE